MINTGILGRFSSAQWHTHLKNAKSLLMPPVEFHLQDNHHLTDYAIKLIDEQLQLLKRYKGV